MARLRRVVAAGFRPTPVMFDELPDEAAGDCIWLCDVNAR
jgi:hypothetical protein